MKLRKTGSSAHTSLDVDEISPRDLVLSRGIGRPKCPCTCQDKIAKRYVTENLNFLWNLEFVGTQRVFHKASS